MNKDDNAPADAPAQRKDDKAAPASQRKDEKPARDEPKHTESWREELKQQTRKEQEDESNLEGIIPMETEEDVEDALAKSRARREALIAKWVTKGEGENGGGLEMPDTKVSNHDDDAESDGEVAAYFEQKKKDGSDKKDDANDIEEKKRLNKFILSQRAEHDGDMFGDSAEKQDALNSKINTSAAISQTGASADDWNDAEGYYKPKVGELMGERYLVVEDACGKGTFSNVVKAKDQQDKNVVAIKIMRCNDMMRKAAEKEIEILQRLNASDKGNKRNVIRLIRTFNYREHLCLVFECMWDNLRAALKKYTKDKGMSLKAVRAYTKQLLVALQHIHRCGIIHADIKPDNILISAGHNLVKICDLGSAMELSEVEPTPYLVSRFYRAPEITIGAKYGPPCDIFAMGATLCEIFTGKVLFRGKSNNDMIRFYMDVKGKIPVKMIKTGSVWKQHFDENLDFKYNDYDKMTKKKCTRIVTDCAAKKPILDIVMERIGAEKQKSTVHEDLLYVKKAKQFADLINQMITLDPEKRATADDLLKHAFLTEGGFGKEPKPAKGDSKGDKVAPMTDAK